MKCSVKETDWRAELESFTKGVAEDSAEASQLVHKGLERFPKEATAHLPAGLGAGLEGLSESMTGSLDSAQVQEHINKVPSSVSRRPSVACQDLGSACQGQ